MVMTTSGRWRRRAAARSRRSGTPYSTSPSGKSRKSTSLTPTRAATPEDFQREIIDFDSEGPQGAAFFAFTTATGLSRFTEIPWPNGLAPKADTKAREGPAGALPKADALVVTWTVDEGHALSRVLTPGKDSRNDWIAYKHNFASIAKKMQKGCPALAEGRLGAYWTGTIGSKRVVYFKSDSHLSQDTKTRPNPGETLPNEDLWQQIIEEVQPQIVITTGTAGGIGRDCEVGDVIVSPIVAFDCLKWLRSEPFARQSFKSAAPEAKHFAVAKGLFKANAERLPPDNKRPPKIIRATSLKTAVLTTDFFGFDTSNNHYGLQGLGSVSEMGDAVLGLVRSRTTAKVPAWLAVRNVSDPQIQAEGTLSDQARVAAAIYKGFGRWSSVCSAIVCWSLIAA